MVHGRAESQLALNGATRGAGANVQRVMLHVSAGGRHLESNRVDASENEVAMMPKHGRTRISQRGKAGLHIGTQTNWPGHRSHRTS